MNGVTPTISGSDKAMQALTELLGRVKNRGAALAKLGKRYVGDEIPAIFSEGGPPGQKWPRVIRDGRSADPLMDVGTLQKSVQWQATDVQLTVGVPSASPAGKYARLHQLGSPSGGTVPTSSKWLLIPLSPPLTPSQRRAVSRRGGFKAVFPDAFFLFKGPEGPGLYLKTRRAVVGYTRGAGKPKKIYGKGPGIMRIAAARKSVKIKPRPFLVWTQRFLEKGVQLLTKWLAEGKV